MSLFALCYIVSVEEGDVVYDRFEISALSIQYTYHTVVHTATLPPPTVVICHSPFRNTLSEELFFETFQYCWTEIWSDLRATLEPHILVQA